MHGQQNKIMTRYSFGATIKTCFEYALRLSPKHKQRFPNPADNSHTEQKYNDNGRSFL